MSNDRRCLIPAMTLPPCDLPWGHDGDMHSNRGDGFFAREHDAEHHRRQAEAAQEAGRERMLAMWRSMWRTAAWCASARRADDFDPIADPTPTGKGGDA